MFVIKVHCTKMSHSLDWNFPFPWQHLSSLELE